MVTAKRIDGPVVVSEWHGCVERQAPLPGAGPTAGTARTPCASSPSNHSKARPGNISFTTWTGPLAPRNAPFDPGPASSPCWKVPPECRPGNRRSHTGSSP